MKSWCLSASTSLLLMALTPVASAFPAFGSEILDDGRSPAVCGPNDIREPGIQGEVPAGQLANYNCGMRLVGSLPIVGNVQGIGTCAYVRTREGQVHVIDVRDPKRPTAVGAIRVESGSETMRIRVAGDRALLVSGSSVYDVRDCLRPVHLGEIKWPPLSLPGIPSRPLPHDLRINHAATKVYASFGLWEADLTRLGEPESWTVTDHRCTLAAQQPGPWKQVHATLLAAGLSLCADAAKPPPAGAGYAVGASPLQSSFIWPAFAHSPDLSADDRLLFAGDQAGGTGKLWAPRPKVRILDFASGAPKIIGEVDGPGHGLDWFRTGGRDYVLHSNEAGTRGILNQPSDSDTCRSHPRPTSLGWGFEVIVSDVTDPGRASNVAMLRLAINEPKYCEIRKASGQDPWVAYHLIDDASDATFAMVNFGSAGLRIFDIRNPRAPREVAYYNHGVPVHGGIGHYDPERKLIYAAGSDGLWILELERQVRQRLGL